MCLCFAVSIMYQIPVARRQIRQHQYFLQISCSPPPQWSHPLLYVGKVVSIIFIAESVNTIDYFSALTCSCKCCPLLAFITVLSFPQFYPNSWGFLVADLSKGQGAAECNYYIGLDITVIPMADITLPENESAFPREGDFSLPIFSFQTQVPSQIARASPFP